MSEGNRCPQCQAELPSDAPDGQDIIMPRQNFENAVQFSGVRCHQKHTLAPGRGLPDDLHDEPSAVLVGARLDEANIGSVHCGGQGRALSCVKR